MAFFSDAQDSPINFQGQLNEFTKNPDKLTPRYVYEESRTVEDHIKVFKEFATESRFNMKMWLSICSLTPLEK